MFAIEFVDWSEDGCEGYTTDEYARVAGVDLAATYNSREEATEAACKMSRYPDQHGVFPVFAVTEI